MSIFLMHRRRLKIVELVDDGTGFGRDIKLGGLAYFTIVDIARSFKTTTTRIFDILVVGSDLYFNCSAARLSINNNAFKNNLNIRSIIDYNDKIYRVNTQAFRDASNLEEVQLLGVQECRSGTHFTGTAVEHFYLPAAVVMDKCVNVWYGSQAVTIHMPNVISIIQGTDMVSLSPNLLHWNTPKLAVMGGYDGSTGLNFFRNIAPGVLITVSDVLATSNNGGWNENLVYAQNRGCTIEFVSNP